MAKSTVRLEWAGKAAAATLAHPASPPPRLCTTDIFCGPTVTATGADFDRLIHGDCLDAMHALIAEGFAGTLDLIAIDPPFNTASQFRQRLRVGNTNLERPAYSDQWGQTCDAFLNMLYPRLILMRELLSRRGSLYVHLDWHAAAHVKLLLDEIFGSKNFVNEIVFEKDAGARAETHFPRKHDVIFLYAKNAAAMLFNGSLEPALRQPYNHTAHQMHFRHTDNHGRTYREYPNGKRFLAEHGKLIGDIWTGLSTQRARSPLMSEYTGYDTQKPEALLERIVAASSESAELQWLKRARELFVAARWRESGQEARKVKPAERKRMEHNWLNDFAREADPWLKAARAEDPAPTASVVADFFCGSGTTLAVARRMGRRTIGCDQSLVAIQVTRSRLLGDAHLGKGLIVQTLEPEPAGFAKATVIDSPPWASVTTTASAKTVVARVTVSEKVIAESAFWAVALTDPLAVGAFHAVAHAHRPPGIRKGVTLSNELTVVLPHGQRTIWVRVGWLDGDIHTACLNLPMRPAITG